jgi:hypothetical protein
MGDTDSSSNTSKGPVCYYLDKLSEREDSCARLRALLEALDSQSNQASGYGNFVKAFKEHVLDHFGISDARKKAICDYLQSYWFDQNGWWPQLQPIEPAFTLGVVEALTRAIECCPDDDSESKARALPIDAFWVTADRGFEVVVTRNSRQVNLLFLTPPPPKPRQPLVWAPSSEIWSVREGGASDAGRIQWERKDGGRVDARGTVLKSKVIPRSEE